MLFPEGEFSNNKVQMLYKIKRNGPMGSMGLATTTPAHSQSAVSL